MKQQNTNSQEIKYKSTKNKENCYLKMLWKNSCEVVCFLKEQSHSPAIN